MSTHTRRSTAGTEAPTAVTQLQWALKASIAFTTESQCPPPWLCERIPRPADVLLRPIKERNENGQKCDTPVVNDGAVHRITRNEHEITGLDSPGLIAYSEPARAFQDEYEFVMIRLDVNDVFTFLENVDVA